MNARPKRAKRRVGFVVLRRACVASVSGEVPDAARILRAGVNPTDKGDLDFTPRSAEAVMQAFEKRGNPLAWYYEHEDRIPLEKRGGAPMKGACAAPRSVLAIHDSPEGPECWAEQIAWTDEAKRQIASGERTQISPVALFDEDTREVLEIINVSLCAEGATHSGTLLASRGTNMDEIINKILAAIEAGDWEAAESAIQEAEAMDGGAAMAKMARAAMKAAKDDTDPKPEADDVATKKLAATLAATRNNGNLLAAEFSRALSGERNALLAATRAAEQATKESKRTTVRVLIAASREFFDAADEREHLNAADPAATERHIASMQRKAKSGVLVAKREGDDANTIAAGRGPGNAKPPKSGGEDPTHGLTVAEIQAATKMNVSLADYAATKAQRAAEKGN